ncbi:MAG: tetratricopeptide repeat protein [Candidatus Acidiferrum sp.]
MILRLSDSIARALIVVAALLTALWLSFFGIRSAVARYGSEGQTERRLRLAVRLEPENPEYWYMLGRYRQYNLQQPDAVAAENSYREAIALAPSYTDAWLDLATAYELDGNPERAQKAYLEAKKSYPVSADVAWRYGNFLLRQGQLARAYPELRRAVEADPQRAAAAFSRAYRTNPNIDELLAELLPPRQDVYVGVIWEALSAKQMAVAKTVWARLLPLHPRLEMRDVERFVSDLLSAGEFTEARQIWDQGMATMNLPPLFRPAGSVVWDPSFETGINGYAFSWQYRSIDQGVSIDIDKAEKRSGTQSLRLSFDGKHDPSLEAACTLAIVQPGTTYRFSGWIKSQKITTDQGIALRLHALDGVFTPATSTRQVVGTNPWTLVDGSWTSGPDVHRVHICVIRDASEDPDVRISGSAWVDDVNLLPQSAEHAAP